jgi:hypothetical protein
MRMLRAAGGLQRAVPKALGHIDRAHLHVVAPGVLHQLRRRIKTHGLRIEHGRHEAGRLVALEPAAHVDQLGKAGGMAFGKTVLTKAAYLAEDAFGEFFVVASFDHALDQPCMKPLNAALFFPGRHGAPQIVGLACGELGGDHGDLHHLLLKNRHA